MFEVTYFVNRYKSWTAILKTSVWENGEMVRQEQWRSEPTENLDHLMLDVKCVIHTLKARQALGGIPNV